MLNNRPRIDLAEKCIGEIGRSLLVLSHALGHGKRPLSSLQIVADIETRIDELSNHIKSPGMPADYVRYVKRIQSPIKKELAQFDDYNVSLEELAPKLESHGATLYENCFEHEPPTSFTGISCELQKLTDLIHIYGPCSPLATPMASWIAFGVTLLAQNDNKILFAKEHSEIQNRAYAIASFLDTIESCSKKKSLRYIEDTIRFLKVYEEKATINRPTSESLDALEEFNDFVAALCTEIDNSLYKWGHYCCAYSLDHITSLSERVGEMLYSAGQNLFSDEDKHEVEQAFRKTVEILADATKSEFWDDFADLTEALDALMESSDTLQSAEVHLCRVIRGPDFPDRDGSGNAHSVLPDRNLTKPDLVSAPETPSAAELLQIQLNECPNGEGVTQEVQTVENDQANPAEVTFWPGDNGGKEVGGNPIEAPKENQQEATPPEAEVGKGDVDPSYTPGQLQVSLSISSTTLNKYAKKAGVPTPGRGKRNFLYTKNHVIKILHEMKKASEQDLRQRAIQVLKVLKSTDTKSSGNQI